MSRIVQYLNFLGILILAGLCCLQWSANQQLAETVAHLDQTRRDQAAALADHSQQIKANASELTAVRDRLNISESARRIDESNLTTLQAERGQLAAESTRLKQSLQAWISACTARDAAIGQANTTIKSLSARYVDAVGKYNDLVTRYNRLANAPTIVTTQP